MDPDYKRGRVIVITGVPRGLGRSHAAWYIAHGHPVSGCGLSGMEIFELRSTHPEPHNFDAVDVTETVKVGMWAERIIGAQGAPDILINNAALVNRPAPLWQDLLRVLTERETDPF